MKSILLNFYSLNKNLRQDNYDIVFYTFNPTKSTYGSRERERERESNQKYSKYFPCDYWVLEFSEIFPVCIIGKGM